MPINIEDYLERIHYYGDCSLTLDTLQTLQKQHLLSVPFENWNIHDNIPIVLSFSAFFDKIVEQQRGGFCYELNGLFFYLLREIGFSVELISARVYSSDLNCYGEEFDHMAILVTINEENYLVDVGFGEFAFYPLKVAIDEIQQDERGEFMIKKHHDHFVVYKKNATEFQPEYQFSLMARKLSDFDSMCHYHQTSSKSHFTQKRLLSLATEDGRVTLTGEKLIVRQAEQVREMLLSDQDNDVIMQYFDPFPLRRN